MEFHATYKNPDGGSWTRYDEIKQRLGNCRRFLMWAWMSLWYDSTIFAAVFLNSARDTGDMVISRIVTARGKDSGDLIQSSKEN